jgi:hypothetical protein
MSDSFTERWTGDKEWTLALSTEWTGDKRTLHWKKWEVSIKHFYLAPDRWQSYIWKAFTDSWRVDTDVEHWKDV